MCFADLAARLIHWRMQILRFQQVCEGHTTIAILREPTPPRLRYKDFIYEADVGNTIALRLCSRTSMYRFAVTPPLAELGSPAIAIKSALRP